MKLESVDQDIQAWARKVIKVMNVYKELDVSYKKYNQSLSNPSPVTKLMSKNLVDADLAVVANSLDSFSVASTLHLR